MGAVGCYSLDLYCDSDAHPKKWNHQPDATYTGETYGECAKESRQDGWIINRRGEGKEGSGKAICPACSGKGR